MAADPGDETGANVKLLLGGRGAAMFMLFFLLMLTKSSEANMLPFYIFNGFIVVIAVLNFYGMAIMTPTTRWLRNYLQAKKILTK